MTIRPTTNRATTARATTSRATTATANTVRPTTVSARQQVLINADKATIAGKLALAQQEAAQRTAPITGTAAGYDPVTGDRLITTPDGGTIRATPTTDGALTGKRLAVQRFGSSQTSRVSGEPSSGGSGGNVTTQIEAAQRDVVSLFATQERTIGIESPTAGNVYPLMAVADRRYRIEQLSVFNTTPTGELTTAGNATVLVEGTPVVMGETIVEPGQFVALRVDEVGEGILAASVVARMV